MVVVVVVVAVVVVLVALVIVAVVVFLVLKRLLHDSEIPGSMNPWMAAGGRESICRPPLVVMSVFETMGLFAARRVCKSLFGDRASRRPPRKPRKQAPQKSPNRLEHSAEIDQKASPRNGKQPNGLKPSSKIAKCQKTTKKTYSFGDF